MKKVQNLILALSFFCVTFITSAQSSNTENHFEYRYSFEGAQSLDQVQKTLSAVEKLLHVSTVKLEFKEESGRGVFIIHVIEKNRTTESEELFSPSLVKATLIENGLSPIDFIYTEIK